MDYIDKITEKEINYNIMITLMKMECLFAEMLNAKTIPDLLTGGEIDEFTSTDK